MAQVLVGHDTTGSILQFDRDGNPATAGDKFTSMFFLNFSRLLAKDEIKKGSFQMRLGINDDTANPFNYTCLVSDASGTTNYLINSPVGEYGILYATDFTGYEAGNPNNEVGFVFYQAGIVALSPAIFAMSGTDSPSVNIDRKSTRLNSSHVSESRMPSSA